MPFDALFAALSACKATLHLFPGPLNIHWDELPSKFTSGPCSMCQ